jgi:hypothetical protein
MESAATNSCGPGSAAYKLIGQRPRDLENESTVACSSPSNALVEGLCRYESTHENDSHNFLHVI